MDTFAFINSRRNVIAGLSLGLFLSLAWFTDANGAPPRAPILTSVNDTPVQPIESPATYTLQDAIRGVPFDIALPAPPSVSEERSVTPATLGNYINTPGLRLVLQPGDYGDRTFSSQDQEIILTEGVIFNYVWIGGSARRLAIRNLVPRSGNMRTISLPEGNTGVSDILIDGIFSDRGGNRNFVNGRRIAILNSFIRTQDFPLSAFNGSYADIIIANSRLEAYGTTQAGVRLHSTNRLVFVDNFVAKSGSLHNPFRLHAEQGSIEHAYVARNTFGNTNTVMINPGGGGGGTSDIFQDIWFEENRLHAQHVWGGGFITVSENAGDIRRLRVRGNRFYGPGSGVFGTPSGASVPNEPGWVVETNTFGGFREPDDWEFQ